VSYRIKVPPEVRKEIKVLPGHVRAQARQLIRVQLLSFPNGTLLAFLPRITRIFTNFSLTFVSIRAIRGEMPPGETRAFTPNSFVH